MPSRSTKRPKVYVDWKALGICRYAMLGGEARCRAGKDCQYLHPRAGEIKPLWEMHLAKQKLLSGPTEHVKKSGTITQHVDRPVNQTLPGQSDLTDYQQKAENDMSQKVLHGAEGQRTRYRKRRQKSPQRDEQPPGPQRAALTEQERIGTSSVNAIPLGKLRTRASIAEPVEAESGLQWEEERGTPDVGGFGVAAAADCHRASPSFKLNRHLLNSRHPTFKPAHKPSPLHKRMAGIKRQSNGDPKPIGPHPSTIRVSAPYMTAAAIDKKLQPPPATDAQDKSQMEAREDSMRLQGVSWLDSTRRALQLPIRTFTTACVYYHKFRLAHPTAEFNWADAAAASLLTSCKVEDTLKKSRDILAMAYNLKAGALEQLGSDDALFEAPSRVVIGLERLVLESGGFDFRSRYPHQLLVKLSRDLVHNGASIDEARKVGRLAYTILTDLHRTFAPLKQTSATMSMAALELAARLLGATSDEKISVRDAVHAFDLRRWSTTREEMMETMLDSLDLYTHHGTSSILGQKYSLDDFLRVRLQLNKECSEQGIARYTAAPEPAADRPVRNSTALSVANGHPTPVSPPQTEAQQVAAANHGTPKEETLRFMLNPQLASDEKQEVQRYFVEEWEEYEEEIEVPNPSSAVRPTSRSPAHYTNSRTHLGERRDAESVRRPGALREERERERERLYERERELDRQRARFRERERERDRQYDDRRYEDRRYDRRYDDRRGTRY